jgi:hypothetical protein
MSVRTCPDWPQLMELAPDLQFKHHQVVEARLPAEALAQIPAVPLGGLEICCDLDHHVVNPEHTDERIVAALRRTHWFELAEWTSSGPGAAQAY